MSAPDRRFRKWVFRRPQGPDAQELIARAERLVDAPRPSTGDSLEWCVEAKHVGDLNAIAITTIRAANQDPTDAHTDNGEAEREN